MEGIVFLIVETVFIAGLGVGLQNIESRIIELYHSTKEVLYRIFAWLVTVLILFTQYYVAVKILQKFVE